MSVWSRIDCGRFGLGYEVSRLEGEHVAVTNDVVVGALSFDQHRVLDRWDFLAYGIEASEKISVFEDGDLCAAVVDEVLDLVTCRRVVDRHWCGSAEQNCHVEGMEFLAIADHHDNRVASTDTEILQCGCEACGVVCHGGKRLGFPVARRVLPVEYFDAAVAFDVGKEPLGEVLSNDAFVQVCAGGHIPIIA